MAAGLERVRVDYMAQDILCIVILVALREIEGILTAVVLVSRTSQILELRTCIKSLSQLSKDIVRKDSTATLASALAFLAMESRPNRHIRYTDNITILTSHTEFQLQSRSHILLSCLRILPSSRPPREHATKANLLTQHIISNNL